MTLFALPFAGVGCFMAYLVGSELVDASAMRSWQPVDATLESAGYRTKTGDDSTTYEAYARYTYRYDLETYTGTRVGIASGADNIGSYQRDTGNRLSAALGNGGTITVYVNPDAPWSAVIDREPRWGLIVFKGVFALVFGGVGFGLLATTFFSKRFAGDEADAASFGDQPWLANDDWHGGPIRSGSRAAMWGAWVFAAFWNVISMPLPFLLYPEVVDKGNYAALLGLLFPIVGVGLLYWAFSRSLEWRRFGPSPVVLDPFPGAIGGHVGGSIDIRQPYSGSVRYEFTLTNLESTMSGSGKNRSRRERAQWQDRRLAHAEPGPLGTRLVFRFDVPEELAASDARQSGNSYTIWRLGLVGEVDGRNLDRNWDIPVYPTGERSKAIDERKLDDARHQQARGDDELVKQRVEVRHAAHGKSLYYPIGRQLGSSLGGLLAGGVFAGAGWFMISQESMWFMGGIFSLVGWGIVLASIYAAGNSLEVWQDGIHLHARRRFLGIPVGTRSLHRNAFQRFEKQSRMSSQSGDKHRFYYSVLAVGRGSEELTLGEGFRGASEAEAGIRLIARELGLPLPDEPSANDDDGPLEYDALAADN